MSLQNWLAPRRVRKDRQFPPAEGADTRKRERNLVAEIGTEVKALNLDRTAMGRKPPPQRPEQYGLRSGEFSDPGRHLADVDSELEAFVRKTEARQDKLTEEIKRIDDLIETGTKRRNQLTDERTKLSATLEAVKALVGGEKGTAAPAMQPRKHPEIDALTQLVGDLDKAGQ
jgi:hypothetical protein